MLSKATEIFKVAFKRNVPSFHNFAERYLDILIANR